MPSSIRGSATSEEQPMSRVMNGSRAAGLTLAWRFAAFRSEGFPFIPTTILLVLVFVAVFADVIAPWDPEIGTLGDRFRPPAWEGGGREKDLPGTQRPRRYRASRLLFGPPVPLDVGAACSKRMIIHRHILPNVLTSAVVLGALMLGVVIVTEAALSFLGVGVPPPKPAWGLMLADGKKGLMAGYWWLTVLPGSCIMLMVLAANLLGDWLRVKLDPQLRQL